MSETKKVNAKAQENKKVVAKKPTTRKTPAKKEPETPAKKPEIIMPRQHPIKDGFKRIGAAAKAFGMATWDTTKAIVKSKPAKVGALGIAALGLYKGINYLRGESEDEEVFEGTEEPVELNDEQTTDTTEE